MKFSSQFLSFLFETHDALLGLHYGCTILVVFIVEMSFSFFFVFFFSELFFFFFLKEAFQNLEGVGRAWK